MEKVFRDLIAFEKACGNELPTTGPGSDSSSLVQLRMNLITEEYEETHTALMEARNTTGLWGHVDPGNMAEIADGLADLIYVAVGTAVRLGIDLPGVWRRVHAANMAKFGPGSSVREDGKRLKPESWTPPDIVGVITNQRPLAEIYQEGGA